MYYNFLIVHLDYSVFKLTLLINLSEEFLQDPINGCNKQFFIFEL